MVGSHLTYEYFRTKISRKDGEGNTDEVVKTLFVSHNPEAIFKCKENHLFGRGYQRTITGRDVRFKPENGWEKMVLISPLRDYVMEDFILNKSEDLGLVKMKDDIVIPHSYRVESYKLKVRVEKKELD